MSTDVTPDLSLRRGKGESMSTRRNAPPRRRIHPIVIKDLATGEFMRQTSGVALRREALLKSHDRHHRERKAA